MRPLVVVALVSLVAALAACVSTRDGLSSADRLALDAVRTRCPVAESEEVETCSYQIMTELDGRILAALCAEKATTCDGRFGQFSRARQKLIERRLDTEGSVVSRIDAAVAALGCTLAFEQKLHAKR